LTLSNFVVNDPLLNNPRINIAGTLLPGQKNTIIATYKITAADNDLGKVNNQATITSTDINNKSYTDISGTTVNTDDITVTIVIKSPVAVDDNVQTKENRTINIDVLKNDIAFNSNLVPSSLIITRMPLYGTLIINSNGSVNYTPNPDYVGSDMFTYTVKDINGMTSNISTVNIAVGKSAPLAVDDSAKTVLNKNIRIDVIGNDIPDGSPLVLSTLKIISQPQHGTLSSNSDGSYTYMPNPDFAGNDEFTYNVEDGYGSISNTATVKIVVDGFFVPNVFTPNGDGVNDTFEIIGKDNYMAIEIEVYNRWGNQVYKNANYQNQWTGQGLNEGTYFYTLKLKSASNTELVKGWVLIKR
jgi:gliding motility-associated-like protein